MATTVLVSEETRDKLAKTRDALGVSSIDEAIQRILQAATPSARVLFARNRMKVLAVCRKYGLKVLIAHGSRARGDATPASDLDLVTTFPDGATAFDFVRAQRELAEAFGCKVDLGSEPAPNSRLARHIKEEGVVLLGARN